MSKGKHRPVLFQKHIYLMDLNHTLSLKLLTPVLPKLVEIKTYFHTTKKWKKKIGNNGRTTVWF